MFSDFSAPVFISAACGVAAADATRRRDSHADINQDTRCLSSEIVSCAVQNAREHTGFGLAKGLQSRGVVQQPRSAGRRGEHLAQRARGEIAVGLRRHLHRWECANEARIRAAKQGKRILAQVDASGQVNCKPRNRRTQGIQLFDMDSVAFAARLRVKRSCCGLRTSGGRGTLRRKNCGTFASSENFSAAEAMFC